jgi:sugar O-acyltransferase (sialic acid O-acetyltransferase NeuD family)
MNMKSVVIVGAGGFGREVLEIFKDSNKQGKKWNILGFIDSNAELHGKIINNYPVLGGLNWFEEHQDVACVCAVGEPKSKKKVIDELHKMNVHFCNAIHPSVIASEFIEYGENVIIGAGSILTVNIKIGNHVIINLNCTIGHDSIIEDYCSIMPTVKINGNNHLHEGVYVGTGATFIQQVSVGAWTTIGAGAVVVNNIPEHVLAIGLPAKVHKHLSNNTP